MCSKLPQLGASNWPVVAFEKMLHIHPTQLNTTKWRTTMIVAGGDGWKWAALLRATCAKSSVVDQ
jgi:hypothetical protein